MEAQLGQNLTIACPDKGEHVQWFRAGVEIIQKADALHIPQLSSDDFGVYFCTSTAPTDKPTPSLPVKKIIIGAEYGKCVRLCLVFHRLSFNIIIEYYVINRLQSHWDYMRQS